MPDHFVRVGALGHVGRFTSVDSVRHARGERVVCRTARGLEVGDVLAPADKSRTAAEPDGTLLRQVTPEDGRLLAQLEKKRQSAYETCRTTLAQRNLATSLVDVELLLDGRTAYFYFMGKITPELQSLTQELAAAYEVNIQIRRFATGPTHGCGAGCGADQTEGGGCGDSCGACGMTSNHHTTGR